MYFLKITEEWPHEPADSMGLQVDTFLLDCCLVLQSQIYEEGIISWGRRLSGSGELRKRGEVAGSAQ
jgi:hypothetical protein